MAASRLFARHLPRAVSLMALVSLAGCASYHAAPLASSPAILAPPEAGVLSADAARIDRPFLTPTPIDLAKPLDGNGVAVIAVLNNPDLKTRRAQLAVTQAQVFAARLLPDPSVAVSSDLLLSGPDPLNNLAIQLSQDIAMLRTAHVVAEAGRAQVRQVRLDLAWAEWQTAGAARLLAVRVHALDEQVTLNRTSAAALDARFAAASTAAGRRDLASDGLEAARLAALDAHDRLNASETAAAAARIELHHLLGLPPETPLVLAAPPPGPAAIPDAAHLLALALHRRTDLEALRAGYAAQEAAVHKAVLDQFPALSLSLGANRDTTGNKLVTRQVGFTLPLWNRNRGGIAIEHATRDTLQAEYAARLAQTRTDIVTAVEAAQVAQRSADEFTAQLPALERHAVAAEASAARGDLPASAAAQQSEVLRERRVQLGAARQALAEAMIALELLTGAPAATWGTDQ